MHPKEETDELFKDLPEEELERERIYKATFATIKIETMFDRMTAIEEKIEQWEQMLHDANLILAGVCIGLFIAIILTH